MPDGYAIVLADPSRCQDPAASREIGRLYAAATGLVPYDALRQVKNAQGILAESLPERETRVLLGLLREAGFPAAAVDPAAVAPFPPPVKARQAAAGPEGLDFQTGYTDFARVAWSTVEFVSLCLHHAVSVELTTVRKPARRGGFGRMMAFAVAGPLAPLLLPSGRKREVKVERILHSEESYVADIHCRAPARRFRIRSRECGYNYLGPRLQERSEWNFQTFLRDVADGAVGALLAPPVGRFLEGDDLGVSVVEELADFESYNRWLCLAAAAFGAGEEETGGPGAG